MEEEERGGMRGREGATRWMGRFVMMKSGGGKAWFVVAAPDRDDGISANSRSRREEGLGVN